MVAEASPEMKTQPITNPSEVDEVVSAAMAERQTENAESAELDRASPLDVSERERLALCCGVEAKEVSADVVSVCTEIVEREADVVRPLVMIAAVWGVTSMFSILRQNDITGVEDCSAVYWVITLLAVPTMIGVSYFMTRREYENYQFKLVNPWRPAMGDIELDGTLVKILKYPLIASIAGVLGGLLGIG